MECSSFHSQGWSPWSLDKKSSLWKQACPHVRASLAAAWLRDRMVGQGGRVRAGWGGSPHSPLLATDVVLLHRVAKEGVPGARDDPGLPGVHVEGVREPWVGEERRGEESGRWRSGPQGCGGPTGRPLILENLGCGRSMFPYLGEPLCEVVAVVPAWPSPQSDGRGPAPALWGP